MIKHHRFYCFWAASSPLSNFYPINGDKSCTSEKIYMLHKALFFGDCKTAAEISIAKTPEQAKKLGREVEGFNEDAWVKYREHAMVSALKWKFFKCKEFVDELEYGFQYEFVEASPYDKIWGTGCREQDLPINPDHWKGQNLLGVCLNRVHSALMDF